MSIYNIEPFKLIKVLSEKLKEYPEIKPPSGSEFWKSAFYKELAPLDQENFWYIRSASILRKVWKFGPIGVNRMRKKYGGRNRRGSKPNHSAKGSGKIIRLSMQQLEDAKLLEKIDKGGRKISPEGNSLLERTAHQIIREK
jgi:small subunit ribosomal protein S19e